MNWVILLGALLQPNTSAPAPAMEENVYTGPAWPDKEGKLRCRRPDKTIVFGPADAAQAGTIDKDLRPYANGALAERVREIDARRAPVRPRYCR